MITKDLVINDDLTLDDLCVNLEIAKSQLESEMKTYLNDRGCYGFIKQGCYKCNGYNKSCTAYLPQKELEK